jgi:6-phosphogluconolactonase
VFVSNRGHDSLAVFNIGAEGQLALAGIYACGGNVPRNFALAPGGRFVLVGNQMSNEVTVLPLDGPEGLVGSAVASLPAIRPGCSRRTRCPARGRRARPPSGYRYERLPSR